MHIHTEKASIDLFELKQALADTTDYTLYSVLEMRCG